MDWRFDQQFAELFAASLADEGGKGTHPSLWPLIFVSVFGLAVFAVAEFPGVQSAISGLCLER
ncbi:hypothetical protein [Albidovulum sediminis]|uniref:Uncharacterized protein n=1 Tax=Albidovulum sediminis TaxID=3066345 RepID=A0ABT2NRC5_9RHOB|nr:hypothetical protein [Defluviimonas sediminis]MCT8331487.1 hypothetical protein [Defluviimonas sediminis]